MWHTACIKFEVIPFSIMISHRIEKFSLLTRTQALDYSIYRDVKILRTIKLSWLDLNRMCLMLKRHDLNLTEMSV